MEKVEFKIDVDPKNNYEKAKKLLYETDSAIQALSSQEQQRLAQEFSLYKGMYSLYQMMQQKFG